MEWEEGSAYKDKGKVDDKLVERQIESAAVKVIYMAILNGGFLSIFRIVKYVFEKNHSYIFEG